MDDSIESLKGVVEALESENEEAKRINAALQGLIEDTKSINKVLEDTIKEELTKEKGSEFIRDMLG